MIGTNTDALTDLFREAIVGIVPTITYKGAEGWKPYNREAAGPSTTRRFRIGWSAGSFFSPGIFTDGVVETLCECRIRTDYAGNADEMQHAIIEDYHQLCETLAALKSPSNGLMLVERDGVIFRDGDPDNDVVQVDHTFQVRYLRART